MKKTTGTPRVRPLSRRAFLHGAGVALAVPLLDARLPAFAGAAAADTVAWDPSAKQVREPDTLFMPDLSSWKTILAEGGHWANGLEPAEKAHPGFEFGPGRFDPAVRGKPGGRYNFVNYPIDGLVPGDAFTVEFQARWDRPWSELMSGRPIFALSSRGNSLEVSAYKGVFHVKAGVLQDVPQARVSKSWEKPCDDLKLTADAWHAIALTLKQGTLRVYVDGTDVGRIDGLRLLPVWSDNAGSGGIQIGGGPGAASGFWISDVRISRTARVPGRAVALRPLAGTLDVDAGRPAGRLPPALVGALHPGGTPEQGRAALHAVRTDKLLTATPMKRGDPDARHPAAGRSKRFAYDWQVVDRTFDWFKARGIVPYISIDSTPSLLGGKTPPYSGERLATALSRSSRFTGEPPEDLDDWALVVGDLVHRVLNERKDTVPWWGVWNEPDLTGFWNADLPRYLDLYAATVRAVKSVDPDARVGGPAVAGANYPWIKALFERCAKDKLPLDFIEYHEYSGDLSSLDEVRAAVDAHARASGFPTPFPIVLGEFNWSARALYKRGALRFRDGMWHLRSFGAAYTTAALCRLAEMPGFELLVYSHTEYGDPRAGGWASTQLIGPRGEQWAPYNALKGWKATAVGDRLTAAADLPPGVFATPTRDPATGRIGLVLANYGFAQRQPRAVEVTVRDAGAGAWVLKRFLVDAGHSSRWDVAEDRDEGGRHNDLEIVEHGNLDPAADGTLTFRVELPAWSSTFVTLQPPR